MSVNKVILLGFAGKDPEVKDVNGTLVVNLTLATTERGYKTKEGAQIPDRTEWHNIVAWNGIAKVIKDYVRKGSKLYIEGKLKTRTWEDSNGSKRYVTEVLVENLELLSAKEQNQQHGSFIPPQQPQTQQFPIPDPSEDDLPF